MLSDAAGESWREAAELFHSHLNTATQETPAVVLELAETQFVDSSGIRTLVRQMTHARSRGGLFEEEEGYVQRI